MVVVVAVVEVIVEVVVVVVVVCLCEDYGDHLPFSIIPPCF
jgi:hypothetical protein